MALTDINSEDRQVQQTFAEHLEKALGWESIYAYNAETFGAAGTLRRGSAALTRATPSAASARPRAGQATGGLDHVAQTSPIDPQNSPIDEQISPYRAVGSLG